MSGREPLRIGALLSGGGRTLLNLLDRIDEGSLDAEVVRVISSRTSAAGVDRCRARGLDVDVITRTEAGSEDAMHDAISAALVAADVNLVCLCGYLRWFRIDPPFVGRVVNIHPSLLPAYGGRGMHGMNVHRAVVEAGERFSGCTVHVVDEEYDHGPIVLQRSCPVRPDDTPESLADRVFDEECEAYPAALRWFAEGRVQVTDGRVIVTAT